MGRKGERETQEEEGKRSQHRAPSICVTRLEAGRAALTYIHIRISNPSTPHKTGHQQRQMAGLVQMAWIIPASGPASQPGSPMHRPQGPRECFSAAPSHRQISQSQSAHNIISICHRPGENHLSWALPCSAHVAVSLMKLVLQQPSPSPPDRPSCISGTGAPRACQDHRRCTCLLPRY